MYRVNMAAIKPHYDKILHVVCTFFAVVWMARLGSPNILIAIIVLAIQIAKTILNRLNDSTYKPYGDWIANSIGWLISGLYLWV